MEYRLADGTTGVYTPLEARLLTRALKRGTTGHGLDAQVRAVARLKEIDIQAPVPLDRIVAEMEYAAMDPLGTYLGSQVARRAEELLDWLNGEGDVQEWPSETPDQPVGVDDYWPYRSFDPMADDQFAVFMTMWCPDGQMAGAVPVTHGDRDEWREREEGPPPWIRGKVSDYQRPDDGVPPDDDE